MADDHSSEDKTEDATPRRQEKAREEGQIPRSRELTTALVLLVSLVALWVFGGHIVRTMLVVFQRNFSISREAIFDPNIMAGYFATSLFDALWDLVAFAGLTLLAALVAPIALGGWLFTPNSALPKLNRLDPMAGLKRMFSTKSLIELGKALAKVGLIIIFSYAVIHGMLNAIAGLSHEPSAQAMEHMLSLCFWASIIIASSTLVIAGIDIPIQIWEYTKKLKMTLQEVKDEMKDSEGRPEVKGRIRQLQREMAQRRMMSNVPKADIVITNPTHYAVALQYDPNKPGAPILLAKGTDQIALKIREIAKASGIESVESPALARSIFHTTQIDAEIPTGLYVAVAQVLAYVFSLRNYRKGRGEKPQFPRNISVPRDLYFD
ncbi:MAG TPA: flagellar biosynthesis protein FlhB [Cellvibrionaceae bacterium]|nr:flagellar biosynthesis protein FlhB [Cellvibrionaceae bacterium]HMW72318.1 flagellar biosynthesis protein FlhB [Cellvibrionaceae bacterium]HMY39433.1 flagellar biosynthesis protein FlhB [Marinagarivorans sp.]HNG60979.1 flagellar biosynthesis protein FlhB [Cellvibrionaceae bacterium]